MSYLIISISLSLTIICAYIIGQRLTQGSKSRPKIFTWIVVPLIALPSLLQIPFPAVFSWLSGQPELFIEHHEYWRLFTAMLVQDGGMIGTFFNIISLVLIAPLAEAFWGWKKAALIFFLSGLALSALSITFGAVSSGSSGATFTLALSMVGASILLNQSIGLRLLAFCPVAIGLLLTLTGNAHGYAMLLGTLVGLLAVYIKKREKQSPEPQRAT